MRDPADTPTDDFEIADPVPSAPAADHEELEEWEDENTDDPVVEEES